MASKLNPTKASSPIAWVGGKSKLTAEIIPIMPAHRCYVEVFAGAAWLLFRKPISKTEVINDINGELVNIYRVIKHHRQAFIDEMRVMPVARDLYNLQRATPPEVLTDIQRAVRFYYTLRTTFGARVVGQTFTISADRPSTFNVEQIEQTITAKFAQSNNPIYQSKATQIWWLSSFGQKSNATSSSLL